MARYRLLGPHFSSLGGGNYLEAGSVIVEGIDVPLGFIPSAMCDPLDGDAIQKFWNAGVQILGLVRSQWTLVFINSPAIFWQRITNIPGQSPRYQLTGAGAALGPRDYNGGTLLI